MDIFWNRPLLKELATDIQSSEQFDSAAQKNLNWNLFMILLLKITITHWLMHAVTMKLESLHKKNYFWSFNFLVGAKSTFYSSNECYVHCWNNYYLHCISMKCFGTKVNRIFLSQRLMGSQEKWNCLYSCLQIWASTLLRK